MASRPATIRTGCEDKLDEALEETFSRQRPGIGEDHQISAIELRTGPETESRVPGPRALPTACIFIARDRYRGPLKTLSSNSD